MEIKKLLKILFISVLLLFMMVTVVAAGGVFYLRKCEWNPEKAAVYATENAEVKSVGLCALYVRRAMIAGGIPLYQGGNAWSYKYLLPVIGFENVNENEDLMVGDIVVFQPIGGRKFGHIAIWNGKQWVSDFKQRSIIVHSDYRSQDCEYAVFRMRQR